MAPGHFGFLLEIHPDHPLVLGGGGFVDRQDDEPLVPAYWRDVECCLQFSGWDFKGHIALDIDGGAGRSLYRVRAQGKFQQCAQLRSARKSKLRRASSSVRIGPWPPGSSSRPAASRLSPWWSCVSRIASSGGSSAAGIAGPASLRESRAPAEGIALVRRVERRIGEQPPAAGLDQEPRPADVGQADVPSRPRPRPAGSAGVVAPYAESSRAVAGEVASTPSSHLSIWPAISSQPSATIIRCGRSNST